MLSFFKFKYLIVLMIALATVVGIGNAAGLTLNSATGQNVVSGSSNVFVADAGTVAYTIDANGDVTATITGLTDTFTSASGSLTGSDATWVACTPSAGQIVCVFDNDTGELNTGTNLFIVASSDS